ncbi:MAG: neprosin family prolyl endopeptidase [Acidobacteriaceae bacterium]|nr:neprosin family prolyl endopeptidase [Acidobacteriaceae bacterium]
MKNKLTRGSIALGLGLMLTTLCQAQTAPAKFVPFRDFVQSVKGTDASVFLAGSATTAKVKEPASVEEMRQHLLKMYDGVSVSHSYVLGSQTFDCIPVDQQLSVRALGLKTIAQPPAFSPNGPGGANPSSRASKLSQLPAGKRIDDFGNALGCESGTIPMTRITLEQLSHFSNLHEFFEKGPNGSGRVLSQSKSNYPTPNPFDHKYAHAVQSVNTIGASTNINLWSPYINTDIGEIFSLAQSWTVGAGAGPLQTLEVGWQNFPGRTGVQGSVPFIYFTADGYQATGCYDLTCPGFVQVDNSVTFGAALDPNSYSVLGGPQSEIQVGYFLSQGNWWLNFNGTWLGYYPGSLYGGGQLSQYANYIDFGSESVGDTIWPAEGSGLFAESGYSFAAYQRLIYYVDLSNNYDWASLTPSMPSPSCYSVTDPAFDNYSGAYFFFGGPGGGSCE